MSNESKKNIPKDKQLTGSTSDGSISFRQWDKKAIDDMRTIGGEILVQHYKGHETIMPMWCAPASSFTWSENKCVETLAWETDPENGPDGQPIIYTEENPSNVDGIHSRCQY